MDSEQQQAHQRKNDKIDFAIKCVLAACLLVPISYILAMALLA